jgi:RNase adapter protein RapZ
MTDTASDQRAAGGAGTSGKDAHQRVLVVTGMSGAGKSAALKALEDMGYEAVDNLPLSLLSSLVQAAGRPLAIGVDIRTRDFGVGPVVDELDAMIRRAELKVDLVFVDCEDEVLRRRYTETRRRHPLALDRPVTAGIRHERRMVSALRDRADLVIDTTDFILADLKRILAGHFALDAEPGLSVFVVSFSYRHGLPQEADLVFDVRFLANPHYEEALRPLTGRDEPVAAFVRADPDFTAYFASLTAILRPLLPRFVREGKSYLTIAIGCTGGRHRSVYVTERLAAWLREEGHPTSVSHRDLPLPGLHDLPAGKSR